MRRLELQPATRTQRQLAMLWFAAAISALVLRPVWIAIAPYLRPCTFRHLTGIPCPTCGTTRTALALLDFDFASALAFNPLATIVGVVFIIGGGLAMLWVLFSAPALKWPFRWSRGWTAGVVGVILINWAYLILTD